MSRFIVAAAAASAISLAAAVPASAFPIDIAPKSASGDVVNVQFQGNHRFIPGNGRGMVRGGGGFGGHRGFNGGGRRYGGGYGGGYRHRGYGVGVGAGIAGLAAGAIIGGAIANSQYPAYYDQGPVQVDPGVGYGVEDADAACASRFKSYDPSSGTYLGYDGLRHPCP